MNGRTIYGSVECSWPRELQLTIAPQPPVFYFHESFEYLSSYSVTFRTCQLSPETVKTVTSIRCSTFAKTELLKSSFNSYIRQIIWNWNKFESYEHLRATWGQFERDCCFALFNCCELIWLSGKAGWFCPLESPDWTALSISRSTHLPPPRLWTSGRGRS